MKRGTPDHPKVYDLAERLGVRRVTAVGILELLWHFTARYAPRGDIGRYPDRRIEAACDWRGRRGALVRALVESGWLDPDPVHRLIVHDWEEHADETVRRRLRRRGERFVVAGQPAAPGGAMGAMADLWESLVTAARADAAEAGRAAEIWAGLTEAERGLAAARYDGAPLAAYLAGRSWDGGGSVPSHKKIAREELGSNSAGTRQLLRVRRR